MEYTISQDFFSLLNQVKIFEVWDNTSKQPTWLWSIIIGGVFGVMITFLFGHVNKVILLPIYAFNFFFKKSAFVGDWHVYHWSYLHGKPELIQSFAKTRRGLIYPYTVILSQKTESELKYKGVVDVEKDQLIISFKSDDHQENLIIRLRHPIGKSAEKILAIWLGYDHEGDVASGGLLLSKKELSKDEAKVEISDGIEKPSKAAIIGLRRK
jgi:hypothetical protein